MAELLALTSKGRVCLTDETSRPIDGAWPLDPQDASFLGRSLIAAAAVLCGANTPAGDTLITDAHLPVTAWTVAFSAITGRPVLILSTPGGSELTFELSPQGAREIGAALIAKGGPEPPLADHAGTVH